MGEFTTEPIPAIPLQPGLFMDDTSGTLRLAGTRCDNCGAHFFPRRQVCARCLSTETATVALTGRGVLYTFTIVYQSTPEFSTPYILGYVDLPEGVRVLAPVVGVEIDDVRTGMPVEVRVEVVRADAQGRPLLGYRLYPAPNPSAARGAGPAATEVPQ